MMQLWLVPADERSFQQTLADPVDLTDAPDKPPEFPDEARVWGVRTDPEQGSWERNRRNLARMEQGDPLLVYRNSESRYVATARIGPFWHTTSVRDEYWNGGPALDIYAVEDYAELGLERETVNRVLGYEETFWPQGLWRVAEDLSIDRILHRLDESQ